jgi:hypothetical protein
MKVIDTSDPTTYHRTHNRTLPNQAIHLTCSKSPELCLKVNWNYDQNSEIAMCITRLPLPKKLKLKLMEANLLGKQIDLQTFQRLSSYGICSRSQRKQRKSS